MLRLRQGDPRWGNVRIGRSRSTLATNGCLITALTMIWSKFHYGPKNRSYLRPDEAAKNWTFGSVPGDQTLKYLYWNKANFDGMEFVWRNFGYSPTKLMDHPETGLVEVEGNIIKRYLRSEDYGVVFQLQTKLGEEHWVAGVNTSVIGMACNDPIDATRRWRTWGYGSKYPRCTGWAVMKKV